MVLASCAVAEPVVCGGSRSNLLLQSRRLARRFLEPSPANAAASAHWHTARGCWHSREPASNLDRNQCSAANGSRRSRQKWFAFFWLADRCCRTGRDECATIFAWVDSHRTWEISRLGNLHKQ